MKLLAVILALTPVDTTVCGPCEAGDQGVNLIQHFEGYSPFVYRDVAGKATIGFGHLILPGQHFDEPMLPDEGDTLLRKDLERTVSGVNDLIDIRLKQNQFDAIVCFTFNMGTGRLESSTLLKLVNEGRHAEVPAQFLRWDRAGGRPVKGLTIRREAEAELYAYH